MFLERKFLVAVDARKYNHYDLQLHTGAEFAVTDMFKIRAGLDDMQPTFGGGIHHSLESFDITIDYGFSSARSEVSSDHIFTVGLLF